MRSVFTAYIRAVPFRRRWHVISLPLLIVVAFYWIDLAVVDFPADIRLALRRSNPSGWIWVAAIATALASAHFWAWYEEHKDREEEAEDHEKTVNGIEEHHRIESESKDRDWGIERTAFEARINSLEKQCTNLTEELRVEKHKNDVSHPDLILERLGDTVSGTIRLYNRGSREAFNIVITELVGENGIIYWRNPPRLPAKTVSALTFVIRNMGEEDNRFTSEEHNSMNMVAFLMHANYGVDLSEEQRAKAFQPVERLVMIKYFDLATKTNWQTPCQFVYDRKSGEVAVKSGDASTIPAQPTQLPPSKLYP